MKKLIVYQIDSFTKEKFRGNPAGVVLNAEGLGEAEMKTIARELNNSETSFLFPPEGSDHDGVIRYFTPTTEVPSCGHATIAAMYAKAIEYDLDPQIFKYKTKIGILPFEVIKEDGDYKVIMTQGKIEINSSLKNEQHQRILRALSLSENDLDYRCPIEIVSTGHGKVMIGIKSKEKLNKLTPDFDTLKQISKEIKCNGYFVFTFDSDEENILTNCRMFAPAIGINEDPVTGNGNGPLGAYLVHNNLVDFKGDDFIFKSKQGEAMGRPGVMEVKVHVEVNQPKLVQIKGEAVKVFRTEIVID